LTDRVCNYLYTYSVTFWRCISTQIQCFLQGTFGESEERRKCSTCLLLLWFICLSFFTNFVGIPHFHAVKYDSWIQVCDDSLIDNLIGCEKNAVEIIIDCFPHIRFFSNHCEDLPDAVDDPFHDKIIFLLIANQVYLQLVNYFKQNGKVTKRKDLIWFNQSVLCSGFSLEMTFILLTLSNSPFSNLRCPSKLLRL